MEIVQIIGIGFAGILIAVLLKEYKPEYKIYISIVVGILIFFLVADKLEGFISLILKLSNKSRNKQPICRNIIENNRHINLNRICNIHMQR